MSTIPPAAVPGPDDLPEEERDQHRQPDPFGEPTDEAGRPDRDAEKDDTEVSDPE